ncbi:hypothetical protein N7539_003808 [Penicillium diatomitis]|uniref:C2H2-type domain-containing protein n=1 Tax=Penicillium diatomitis TaxID=2819901 RepID=A0A9W9XDL1_9EURO|nr:uncharacterized protein N7539_003808 [Penicillium diatomitis]KAJ5488918.1 hypothetical protein N7539_003808 [Penicillium diatomitis]
MDHISTQGALFAPGMFYSPISSTTGLPQTPFPWTPSSTIAAQDTHHNGNGPDNASRSPTRKPSQTNDKRASKAMKGRRVHACEFPGCDKIFTRAEHRRRHELVHKSKKAHMCTFVGCHKSFHRPDYLMQHLARHGGVPVSTMKKPPLAKRPKSTKCSTPDSVQSQLPTTTTMMSSGMLNSVEENESSAHAFRSLGRYHTPDVESDTFEQPHHEFSAESFHLDAYLTMTHPNHPWPNPKTSHSPGSQNPAASFPTLRHETDLDRYSRRMFQPHAYLSPPPSLSPRLQVAKHIPLPYWYNDIDNTLPPIDPALFSSEVPYLRWPSESNEIRSANIDPRIV